MYTTYMQLKDFFVFSHSITRLVHVCKLSIATAFTRVQVDVGEM